MKQLEEIQKYLPIGYLLLIVIGILKVSIFYYQLDINILNYYSLTDIIVNPIADITSEPIMFIALLSLLLFGYFLFRNRQKQWVKKFFRLDKKTAGFSAAEYQTAFRKELTFFLIVGVISFFIGVGLGNGHLVAQKIAKQDLKYDKTLSLIGVADEKEIHLIEANSANYFYVEKGRTHITISPKEAVRSIRVTKR